MSFLWKSWPTKLMFLIAKLEKKNALIVNFKSVLKVLKVFWTCWMFCFWIFSVPYKVFYIMSSWLIIACGTAVISDTWTLLEIAKDLKTKTFPSIVTFLIRYSYSLQYLLYGFENSFHVLVFYCRRNVHQVFPQFLSLD